MRRSSSARSEPSGPIHCGSRVSAATSRAWSSSARATSCSPRPSASSIRRSASLMNVVPIAGRPGEGSAASAAAQSPASKASSERSSISQRRGAPFSARERVALVGDLARLGQPAGAGQRVGEVDVRVQVRGRGRARAMRASASRSAALALLVAGEPEQRDAHAVQRAQLGDLVADGARDLERLLGGLDRLVVARLEHQLLDHAGEQRRARPCSARPGSSVERARGASRRRRPSGPG